MRASLGPSARAKMSIIHIPFYPSDWLAGTRGLSAEETGVYITLIARMYEMAGPIERDDDRLFRLCGCKSKAAFVRCLDYLAAEGKITISEAGLFNERAAKVIEETVKKSDKARQAAESRWKRKSNKNKPSKDANASPEHMPERCQSESELYNTVSSLRSDTDGGAVIPLPDDVDREFVWSRGVQFLCKCGTSERQARSVIGKWLKDARASEVRAAFRAAQEAKTGDPIPYITEILKPQQQPDIAAIIAKVSEKARAK